MATTADLCRKHRDEAMACENCTGQLCPDHSDLARKCKEDAAKRKEEIRSQYDSGELSGKTETATVVGKTATKKAVSGEDRSRKRIDELHRSNRLPDYAAERAENLVTLGTSSSKSRAQRWIETVGSESYIRAFERVLSDPQFGHTEFSNDERDAWRNARDLQRSMNIGTDASGGFMVPFHLDPAILLTNDGTNNPLRQLARVEQISSDEWHGVSSAGVTASWYPESTEVTDDSPTLAQPTVPTEKGMAFIPFTFEFGGDNAASSELSRVLRDGADRLQAEAFTTGEGTAATPDEPFGVVDSVTGATAVASATAATFAAEDVYAVQNALPPRWSANAQWAASLTVINEINQFETANGAREFPEAREDSLLRKRLHELSDMSALPATTGERTLLYGDFREFLIVDRIGSTIELVPHLFGAAGRPLGERGFLLWFRTGSKVLVREALRVLVIA